MPLDDLRRFGAGVRAIRVRQGMSQERLAELAAIDQTYLSGVERGRRNVGIRNVFRIARALGVSTARLMEEGEGIRRLPTSSPRVKAKRKPMR